MTDRAPSVFESYNARTLPLELVASSFVPPTDFPNLIRRQHSILVGPRGSGKTTLLKMLQQRALDLWRHPNASATRSQLSFTGVFIPTDVQWSEQLNALEFADPSPGQHLLGMSAFTSHVLLALTRSMQYRLNPLDLQDEEQHYRVSLDPWEEAGLASSISEAWHLPACASLQDVVDALTLRSSEISMTRSIEDTLDIDGRAERLAAKQWLHLDFISCAIFAIEKFNSVADDESGRWALLFDEVELAPEPIATKLLTALRSSDERLLFKLSYSPVGRDINALTSSTAAMPGQDFSFIRLYRARKEENYRFSRELIEKIVAERRDGRMTAEDIFGHSVLDSYGDTSRPRERELRERDRIIESMFIDLAHSDRSFRRYLLDKGINPNQLAEVTGDARAATVRKIVGLVAVRAAFRAPDGRRQARRSRKVPDPYSGVPAMFALLEGNPRWIIGVVNAMLDAADKRQLVRVRPSLQNSEIKDASERFHSLLRTIVMSEPQTEGPSRATSVGTIVDLIGRYFQHQIVQDDFRADPQGTFLVDARVSSSARSALADAVKMGAVVLVDSSGGPAAISDLQGHRFRLSYLLAPEYGLPLRLDKPVNLSSILSRRQSDAPLPGLVE